MKITFTVTKQDAWRHQWRNWIRLPLRLTLQLSAVPLVAFVFCYFGGLGVLLSAIVMLVTGVVPFVAFLLMLTDLFRKVSAVKAGRAGTKIAETGKFDFRMGPANSAGYYHHWSYFNDITETNDYLYFVLRGHQPLQVPKSAFADPATAQAFLAEAHSRWEAAQVRQAQITVLPDETVWPPPPHIGA